MRVWSYEFDKDAVRLGDTSMSFIIHTDDDVSPLIVCYIEERRFMDDPVKTITAAQEAAQFMVDACNEKERREAQQAENGHDVGVMWLEDGTELSWKR